MKFEQLLKGYAPKQSCIHIYNQLIFRINMRRSFHTNCDNNNKNGFRRRTGTLRVFASIFFKYVCTTD